MGLFQKLPTDHPSLFFVDQGSFNNNGFIMIPTIPIFFFIRPDLRENQWHVVFQASLSDDHHPRAAFFASVWESSGVVGSELTKGVN